MSGYKEEVESAWNAALDQAMNVDVIEDCSVELINKLKAPSEAFDEWYEREVKNPPEGWEDHHAS